MFRIDILQSHKKDATQLGEILESEAGLVVHTIRERDLFQGEQTDLTLVDWKYLNDALPLEGKKYIVTAERESYAYQAFQLGAIGYLVRPYTKQDVLKAIYRVENWMYPQRQLVEIKTFGRFDVFIHGEKVHFRNAKAKELLALLVDRRGGTVTMEEAVAFLWEGRNYDEAVKQLYRKALRYIRDLFGEHQLHCLVVNRGSCAIIPTAFECDVYRLMDGDADAMKQFDDEYMIDYSWSEMRLATISRYVEERQGAKEGDNDAYNTMENANE